MLFYDALYIYIYIFIIWKKKFYIPTLKKAQIVVDPTVWYIQFCKDQESSSSVNQLFFLKKLYINQQKIAEIKEEENWLKEN